MKKLTLIGILMLFVTGCATTVPMKVSLGRAGADVAVTLLMDNGVVSEKQLVGEDGNSGVLKEIENELAAQEYLGVYKHKVADILAVIPGSEALIKALFKSCDEVTGKLDKYRYRLEQTIYQAKYAAKQHKNAK